LPAGLCQAALCTLRKPDKGMHTQVVQILVLFIKGLSDPALATAMAVLVPGGIVEITMAHIVKAEARDVMDRLTLLKYFPKDPRAREAICKPHIVSQLMKWIAERLPTVRRLGCRQPSVCTLLCAPCTNIIDTV
jgi:hypothetical protein